MLPTGVRPLRPPRPAAPATCSSAASATCRCPCHRGVVDEVAATLAGRRDGTARRSSRGLAGPPARRLTRAGLAGRSSSLRQVPPRDVSTSRLYRSRHVLCGAWSRPDASLRFDHGAGSHRRTPPPDVLSRRRSPDGPPRGARREALDREGAPCPAAVHRRSSSGPSASRQRPTAERPTSPRSRPAPAAEASPPPGAPAAAAAAPPAPPPARPPRPAVVRRARRRRAAGRRSRASSAAARRPSTPTPPTTASASPPTSRSPAASTTPASAGHHRGRGPGPPGRAGRLPRRPRAEDRPAAPGPAHHLLLPCAGARCTTASTWPRPLGTPIYSAADGVVLKAGTRVRLRQRGLHPGRRRQRPHLRPHALLRRRGRRHRPRRRPDRQGRQRGLLDRPAPALRDPPRRRQTAARSTPRNGSPSAASTSDRFQHAAPVTAAASPACRRECGAAPAAAKSRPVSRIAPSPGHHQPASGPASASTIMSMRV